MKNFNRIFWGLCLIAIAALLLLSQMNLLTVGLSFWQIGVGILAAVLLINSILDREFFGIFLALGLGWITFGGLIGLPQISAWVVIVVAILLSIGFSTLFPGFKRTKTHVFSREEEWRAYEDGDSEGRHQQVEQNSTSEYEYCMNRFGALTKYINTESLKTVQLENSFGELRVFFDHAKIAGEEAKINVSNSFGSIKLYIPRDWEIVNNVSVFAGECKCHQPAVPVGAQKIILSGSVNFGDIEIILI